MKIVKRGARYCVYRLKRIRHVQVIYADAYKPSEMRYQFEWEETLFESWTYKPYEDKDVDQELTLAMVKHVKTWFHHLVSWNIPTTLPATRREAG